MGCRPPGVTLVYTSQTGSSSRSTVTTHCSRRARAHEGYLSREVLARSVSYESPDGELAPLSIDGRELSVTVALPKTRL